MVQTHILRPLLNNANIYLEQITDRYKLTCSEENERLAILVMDRYNKDAVRSATVLSGGERFMVSLALSLALSSLNRPDFNVNILFIDEGFGTLDEKSLDSVMSTLEKLQAIAGQSNRRVGIISHREELNERIRTQIRVTRHGEGRTDCLIPARCRVRASCFLEQIFPRPIQPLSSHVCSSIVSYIQNVKQWRNNCCFSVYRFVLQMG